MVFNTKNYNKNLFLNYLDLILQWLYFKIHSLKNYFLLSYIKYMLVINHNF